MEVTGGYEHLLLTQLASQKLDAAVGAAPLHYL